MTIAEFLLARIAEDEAVAKLPRGRRWSTDSCYEIEDENGRCVLEIGHDGQYDFDGDVISHMARHDPARVLAECAAKRAIIADRDRIDRSAGMDDWYAGYSDANLDAVRALAAVYADHPDYRQEWGLVH